MSDAMDLVETLREIDFSAIAQASLKKNEEVIADLNATQMSRGRRADGTEILPSYRPLTVELKGEKSGLAGVTTHVTLFDTGDHYKGLYAKVSGDKVDYGSRDEKSEKLQEKYSTSKGSIYGLNEDSREELIESHLRSDMGKELEAATALGTQK